MQDDRRVEEGDILALLHERALPLALHVLLQEDAVVAVVVRRAEPAVDVRGGVDEAAPPRQRRDLLDRRLPFVGLEHPTNPKVTGVAVVELHIVSDATGETATRVVLAT